MGERGGDVSARLDCRRPRFTFAIRLSYRLFSLRYMGLSNSAQTHPNLLKNKKSAPNDIFVPLGAQKVLRGVRGELFQKFPPGKNLPSQLLQFIQYRLKPIRQRRLKPHRLPRPRVPQDQRDRVKCLSVEQSRVVLLERCAPAAVNGVPR